MIWDLDIRGSLLALSKSLELDIHFLGGLNKYLTNTSLFVQFTDRNGM